MTPSTRKLTESLRLMRDIAIESVVDLDDSDFQELSDSDVNELSELLRTILVNLKDSRYIMISALYPPSTDSENKS